MSPATVVPVPIAEAARDFLAQKRVALVGVSRRSHDFSRAILRRLRSGDREVIPVNPAATEIDGLVCYPNLRALPQRPDAVLVVAPAAQSAAIVHECVALGIRRVWLHRSLGPGSASDEAVTVARDGHLTLIRAGCPMMFCEPVDVAHRCFRWCLTWTGRIPKTVAVPAAPGQP